MTAGIESGERQQWSGLPVSGGVVQGVAHVLKKDFDEPEFEPVDAAAVDHELERFQAALEATRLEIVRLQAMVAESAGSEEAMVFETHLLILQDNAIRQEIEATLRSRPQRVDAVYYRLMLKHINALRGKPDPYLRERFIDIKDVTQRVMRHLRGELLEAPMFDHPVIIVAQDLTPSDTVQLDRSRVLGFAVEAGSTVSHAAIIARSLGVPAVVRLSGVSDTVHSGDQVILDGDRGQLIRSPSDEMIRDLEKRVASEEERILPIQSDRHEPAVTRDGTRIVVGANAEFLEEIPAIRDGGADEIGLFRTEFLHMADPSATEESLVEAYGRVVRELDDKWVLFRTLDLGGDKVDPELQAQPEPNPFLGWRGLRLSLGKRSLFRRQLRALLKAGSGRKLGIMFPMVTHREEVAEARAILAECERALAEEGVAPPSEMHVGAMIEVPGAAIAADTIAPEVDFFSIGTNDLIQYSLAVDRLNDRVADLYQPTHPGVLRLIRMTIEAGRRARTSVAMCGEMAADLRVTPLLLGLGLREFSVAPGMVPRVKHAIRQYDLPECQQLASELSDQSDPEAILMASTAFASERCPELFSHPAAFGESSPQ